ncbi:MAG: hypothetical protein COT45_02105 [bacterium (Candidatus Stahlbacteria) CG08_land_8_20_14_0_20_40_26]|nr:MAG: hypothetical protein COX49_07455 [bacterium (Candidatus Stahlbacteria) CG23_combo_of_CG06-09_8_20_14_all_40_9]PIS25654.1 MAG: hypothetical protein COT45_02105 [bacterium (Candidatus Stahlbacteria) CG08_land_8_20_14_0_20_40_26]
MGIAEDFERLTEDFVSSYDERMAVLNGIKKDTRALLASAQDLLAQFEKARNKMGTELRKTLERDNTAMQDEVKRLMKGFASERDAMAKAQKDTLLKGVVELRDEVSTMLDGFTKARGEMARALRSGLAKDKKDRSNEVARLLDGFRREQKILIDELKKTNAAWNKLVSEMAKKRGTPVKPVVKPRPPKPKVEEKVVPEVEEVKPEETLEEGILRIVNSNPDGIVLRDIGDSLGLAPIRLARTIKALVDEGKIRKEDNLYYPVE